MRADEFREILRRWPFQAFRMHLSTGLTHDVRHRDFALVGRSIVWLYPPTTEDETPTGENEIVVNLLHIVWIEFLAVP
jgi:hypothetical protein